MIFIHKETAELILISLFKYGEGEASVAVFEMIKPFTIDTRDLEFVGVL